MTPRDSSPAGVPSVSGETHSGIRNLPCYLASRLAPGSTLVVGASPLGLDVAARAAVEGGEVFVADPCGMRLAEVARIAHARGVDVRELQRDVEREPLGLAPRTIANVICLEGLEAFRDDVGVLEKLHRVLEPEGRLVVRVCAHWAGRGRTAAADTHRRFDAEMLRDSLEEAGFRPLSLRHWNFLGIPGALLHERVLRRGPTVDASVDSGAGLHPPRHWWDRGIDLWFRAVENRVGFPIGVSLIAVATPYLEKASVRSVEPGRVFSARAAREAYEPMAVER